MSEAVTTIHSEPLVDIQYIQTREDAARQAFIGSKRLANSKDLRVAGME